MSENISIGEVCRLLEALDEWEEVALHLGLSDQTIQEIRGLSGGNRVRREAMISKWLQREDLEPSWSKLEEALVSAGQEPHAAKIRSRSRTPTNPVITATNSDRDLKEASDTEKEIEAPLSTVDNKTLKEDDWNIVSVECGSLAAKWEQLSGYLGLAKADIDRIRESRPRDIAGCWSEALSQWIKQNYSTQRFGLPSWRSLLKAVATVDRRLYKELATKHPLETLQVPSAIVQPPATVKKQQNVEMIRSNVDEIKALFSSLVLEVQLALQSQSDIRNVRNFLTTFFKYDFSETSDLEKLFTIVTLNDLWDYHNYSPLERLVNKFLPNDQNMGSLMKEYKARLSGFYLTTKLIVYIEYQNLSADDSDEECDQPSPKLTPKQYRKIKVVLRLERKISQVSLDYVVKLWQSFAEEYEIPSLTAVIDRIVVGSLEVTWTVPQHIADAILPRSKFFRSHGIVLVSIDDVIIYDEKRMAAKEKRFLKLCRKDTADIKDFTSLLAQGVDPDIYDQRGNHPLWHVSYDGRQDLVELFLKYHADVNMTTNDEFRETALGAAVDEGHLHIAEILVKNGADVNYRNKEGVSVLWSAAQEGKSDIVLLLLQHGALVNLPNDNDFGNTALVAAVDENHLHVVEILVKNGADVNYRNKEGVSVLWSAAYEGNGDIVLLLLHHGAVVNLPNDNDLGNTALVAAMDEGHLHVAEILVENGADVNYRNKEGESILWSAAYEGNRDIVLLLLRHHATVDLPNNDEYGETALFAACSQGHYDPAALLIDHGADVNYLSKEGRTGLMIVAWSGYSSIVAELVRAGAQIDAQDQEGLTSLMLAVQNKHVEVVELLLNAKADPNITENIISWSPLHFAAKSANVHIIKLLLQKGADAELRDKNGQSAIDVCEDEDVCDELRRHTTSQTQTSTQKSADENQRNKEKTKSSYQKLLKIFDLLEDSLLRGRKEKRLHQQKAKTSSNIEAN